MMEFRASMTKIPESCAITSIATDLIGSGQKPAVFKFPIPEHDVIFHTFAQFSTYPGDDLRQIILEDVKENSHKYEPFIRDFWQRKGQTMD